MINLGTLKNIANAKKYLKDDQIANGCLRAQMFIVLKGEVGAFVSGQAQNEKRLAIFGPGDFFGETAFFLEKDMCVNFVALTAVIVLPIYRHFIHTFIKDEPELCFELMKEMCDRLYDISAAYEEQPGHPWTSPKTMTEETLPEETPADLPVIVPNTDPIPTAPPQSAVVQATPQGPCFSLFPEQHGSYTLPSLHSDKLFLMEKGFICPVCKKSIKSLKVKPSKLITDITDKDMRIRYKGVEPIYYDIVTCPHCLYSALADMFESPDKADSGLRRELEAIKPEIGTVLGTVTSPFSVFAGYYLALFCAPKCFCAPHLAVAKLLLKLHWIYQDCKDQLMEEITARRALHAYMYVYQNVTNPPKIDQQLCLIIGELYIKLNDTHNARSFLLKAQSNREGIPLLRTKAAGRIADVREMEGEKRSNL